MDFLIVNVQAVLFAALAIIVVSVVWRLVVMQEKLSVPHLLLSAVLSLVTAYGLGLFISWAGVVTPIQGGIMGFIAALGLVAPALLQLTIHEKRSVTLFRFGVIRILIEMALAGAILGGWH